MRVYLTRRRYTHAHHPLWRARARDLGQRSLTFWVTTTTTTTTPTMVQRHASKPPRRQQIIKYLRSLSGPPVVAGREGFAPIAPGRQMNEWSVFFFVIVIAPRMCVCLCVSSCAAGKSIIFDFFCAWNGMTQRNYVQIDLAARTQMRRLEIIVYVRLR